MDEKQWTGFFIGFGIVNEHNGMKIINAQECTS